MTSPDSLINLAFSSDGVTVAISVDSDIYIFTSCDGKQAMAIKDVYAGMEKKCSVCILQLYSNVSTVFLAFFDW